MNKIYDKLILAVAVLLLAGGVFLYLQKSGATPSLTAPLNIQLADNPYLPQEMPATTFTEARWPESEPQSTGWRYDVFTPPKIFIDENGQFSEVGWEPPVPPPHSAFISQKSSVNLIAYSLRVTSKKTVQIPPKHCS